LWVPVKVCGVGMSSAEEAPAGVPSSSLVLCGHCPSNHLLFIVTAHLLSACCMLDPVQNSVVGPDHGDRPAASVTARYLYSPAVSRVQADYKFLDRDCEVCRVCSHDSGGAMASPTSHPCSPKCQELSAGQVRVCRIKAQHSWTPASPTCTISLPQPSPPPRSGP
jgi:hypothetical protein